MLELEIRQKLAEIQTLKLNLEDRLWKSSLPAKDFDGQELTQDNILKAIHTLADQIITAYPNECPVLVGLMDGALPFASKLNEILTAANYKFQYTSMATGSYGTSIESGKLTLGSLPKIHLAGRKIIVIDDVIDKGHTYEKVKELFESLGADSVDLVALVDKVQKRPAGCEALFAGFRLAMDAFIIGYGLDFAGVLRNTTSIRTVDKAFLPTKAEQELLDSEESLNRELQKIIAEKAAKLKHGEQAEILFAVNPAQTASAVDMARSKEFSLGHGS